MDPAPANVGSPAPPADRMVGRRCLVAFVGLLLLFCTHLYGRGKNLDPSGRDQIADMTIGAQIHKGGDMTDGNRHPLLPAILSLWASRRPTYIVDARLVAILIAALALLAFYLAAARAFSPPLALLGAAIFALELRLQARLVAPEPLLAGFLIGATALLARVPSARRPLLWSLGAGACLGLAWLAKGTATLSLGAATLWLLWTRRRRALAPVALLWLGFAIAASPLLAYNAQHHGSPFYNANSAHVMWEDAWDQDLNRTSTATPATYFQSHDMGQAVGRLVHGLGSQKGVEWIYGFLALALLHLLFRRGTGPEARGAPRAWRGIGVLTCLVWLPLMAWYEPIVAARRMLFPIFGILVPPALGMLRDLVPAGAMRSTVAAALAAFGRRAAWPLLGIATVTALAVTVAHGSPLKEKHLTDGMLSLAEHLSLPKYKDAVILAKPSRTIPPDWILYTKVTFDSIPRAVPDSEAPKWIAERDQYVLVSDGFLAQRRGFSVPSDLARWDSEKGIVPLTLPPWLVEEYRDPAVPSQYWLLRVVKREGP